MPDTPTPRMPKRAGAEYGRSGTVRSQGYISGEEYNRDLQGKAALRVWDTMLRSDSTVRAAIQVCVLPLLGATWRLDPAKDDPNGQERAEEIEHILMHSNVNWHDFMRQALSFVPMGFSVFEKVFGLIDYKGRPMVGIYKLGYRKQSSIEKWETEDGREGVTQRLLGDVTLDNASNVVSIPMEKLVVFTHDKMGDNYEGISMLRYAYKPWKIKDSLDLMNAIALERSAIGVPQLRLDPDFTGSVGENEKAEARANIRQYYANEEAFIDGTGGLYVEMLRQDGSKTDVMPTLEYQDRQIVKSVLAQFLELGQGSGGSRALSEDQTKLFTKSLEALAKTFASAVQEQLIKQLCDINYTDNSKGYPQLVYADLADDDTSTLASSLQALKNAGVLTPDAVLEQHLRSIFKLTALPEELVEGYEERRQLADQATKAIAEESGDLKNDKEKPDATKSTTNTPATKVKASAIEAALDEARQTRRRIIKVLNED